MTSAGDKDEHVQTDPAALSIDDAASTASPQPEKRKRKLRRIVAGLMLLWLLAAYLVAPLLWRRYVHRHPSLDDIPGITYTANGVHGDPLNVAFIGSKEELIKIMLAAKWHPADPLTLRSCLEIAAATVLRRPYDDAPVSNLFLFGHREDLAFEQPVGHDPRHRHHVRFWKSQKNDADGRPLWVGSVTYDKGVGFSHTTGQITHHIAADVDAERDRLFQELQETGDLAEDYIVDDFHTTRAGRNGGGDLWNTDGKLRVGVIRPAGPESIRLSGGIAFSRDAQPSVVELDAAQSPKDPKTPARLPRSQRYQTSQRSENG